MSIAPDHNCLNCGRRGNRPRGLCAYCYTRTYIRERFPRKMQVDQTEVGVGGGRLPEPTDVPPGPAKVEVFVQRYDNRLALFHPQDITIGD